MRADRRQRTSCGGRVGRRRRRRRRRRCEDRRQRKSCGGRWRRKRRQRGRRRRRRRRGVRRADAAKKHRQLRGGGAFAGDGPRRKDDRRPATAPATARGSARRGCRWAAAAGTRRSRGIGRRVAFEGDRGGAEARNTARRRATHGRGHARPTFSEPGRQAKRDRYRAHRRGWRQEAGRDTGAGDEPLEGGRPKSRPPRHDPPGGTARHCSAQGRELEEGGRGPRPSNSRRWGRLIFLQAAQISPTAQLRVAIFGCQ
jgi:hypothetical protein